MKSRWSYWRPGNREILEILKRHCSTPKVSDEAKERLVKNGCRVLGYNSSELIK
ncbi:MAG: hypothetical protein OEZ48_09615 [Candidatus Bathyarchaeota archaeon]|nr:hypothetical protein [Candidatus Bathyarchaeota archaeon]MDH5688101.1 hypothetical protein [Candidatus Bathyarchaeota archaeon]